MTEKSRNAEVETEIGKIKSLDEFRAGYSYLFPSTFFGSSHLPDRKFGSPVEDVRALKIAKGEYDPQSNQSHIFEHFHRFLSEYPELAQRAYDANKRMYELLKKSKKSTDEVANHLNTVLISTMYEVYKILRNYGVTDEDLFIK